VTSKSILKALKTFLGFYGTFKNLLTAHRASSNTEMASTSTLTSLQELLRPLKVLSWAMASDSHGPPNIMTASRQIIKCDFLEL
jgi:hypothetical protein